MVVKYNWPWNFGLPAPMYPENWLGKEDLMFTDRHPPYRRRLVPHQLGPTIGARIQRSGQVRAKIVALGSPTPIRKSLGNGLVSPLRAGSGGRFA